MITFSDHFKPQREIISDLLLIEGNEPKTTYINHKDTNYPWTKEELDDWYRISFKSFPLYTSEKSDEVIIPNSFLRTYRKYHHMEPIRETQKEYRKEVDDIERAGLLLDLEEFAGEWIENIFHDFAEAINALKSGPVFACIHDDLTVMKNLLAFYKEVRKTEEIQLNFFHRITMPQSIAHQLTDVLIILLTDRIKMAEPAYTAEITSSLKTSIQNNFKINWLASQQEFAELIHELTDKGYISFPDTSKAMQASNLAKMFDFSASQRKEGANLANNILALLKPIMNKDNNETTYSYLKPTYIKKFSAILARESKKKKKKV